MIILNKMYTGSYLSSQDNNIGHEIINEYKADDEKQYIYVNPYQKVRDLPNEENYVIQIRCVNCNCYEVLSCAKIDKKIEKVRKTYGAELKYGGHTLEDIFKTNSDNAEYYAHFIVSNFKRCQKNTYIYVSKEKCQHPENYIYLGNFTFGKQNHRRYIYNNEKPTYDALIDFINNPNYWSGENSQLVLGNDTNKDELNILDVVGKQYEELAFSNWLAFYLNNQNLCKKFIKECFKIGEEDLGEHISVRREYKHIDILIESENFVIAIENKVDSGINGVEIKSDKDKISQLSEYCDVVNREYVSKKKYYFIITPNYNKLDLKKLETEKFKPEDIWKIINYKQVHKFFNEVLNDSQFSKLKYLDEFVKALKPLTQEHKKDYKEIIENRLMKRIRELEEK